VVNRFYRSIDGVEPESAESEWREFYEDSVSRLSIEASILKKVAGDNIVSFRGLLRIQGELVLIT